MSSPQLSPVLQFACISLILLLTISRCCQAIRPLTFEDSAISGSAEMPMLRLPFDHVTAKRGSPNGDALLDYILNKQAYQHLLNSGAVPQVELAKRNKYRLCSVNAVACFGRKK